MELFDLHCDTASEIFRKKESIEKNTCHVSLESAEGYAPYAQIMAVWTSKRLSDAEGYRQFFLIADYLKKQIEAHSDKVEFVTSGAALTRAAEHRRTAMFLSVEDARILENDPGRLTDLYNVGVRFLTLLWADKTVIGGSHNTPCGLTDMGRATVTKCFDLGIIPDISHASFASAEEVLAMAQKAHKPVIASHSDSYSVNPHSRNLRDEDFEKIKALGGLVGINLCPEHLGGEKPSVDTVLSHIEHYFALGGENAVALGCDLDGTNLPEGFSGVCDLWRIADCMAKHNYTDRQIRNLFWQNAATFVENNL